jgi:hypothetical protein
MNIKIITGEDAATGQVQVANSVVYDIAGGKAVLAQTDPPIHSSMVQKELVVTYVVREEKGTVRYGLSVGVIEFLEDYRLASSEKVRAFRVSLKTDPEPYNIRMYFRAEPSSRSNISMTVDGKQVTVIDLSLGGAKFSHDKRLVLVHYETVHFVLAMDGISLNIEGRVLRTWGGGDERLKNGLMFASAEFRNMDRAVEDRLYRKLIEIERENQRI